MRKTPNTRVWRVLVPALLLVLISLAALVTLAVRSGPDLITRVLVRVLGRPVRIEAVHLHVGGDLEIEVEGLRVFAREDTRGEASPVFETRWARSRQTWPRLLAGQLVPLDWSLTEPVVRLPPGSGAAPRRGWKLPLAGLSVEAGTVEWRPPAGDPLFLRNLRLRATRSPLPGGLRSEGTADLAWGDSPIGRVAFLLSGPSHDLRLRARVEDLDLTALPMGGVPLSGGRASGLVALRVRDQGVDGSAELTIRSLELLPPGFRAPVTSEDTELRGEGSWREGVLRLRPAPLRIDDLAISGDLQIGPGDMPGKSRRLQGWLAVGRFEAGRPGHRLQLLRLMGLRFATWERIDRRVEGGWVEDTRVELNLPLDGLEQALSFRRKPGPEELRGSATIREATYRPRPGTSPLENISASLQLQGNRLEIHDLLIHRNGKPLPRIDLSIDGMHRLVRLPPAQRRTPRGPGVPIPGLGPLFSIRGNDPNQPPLRIHLAGCRIAHPAFVLPFRNVTGWLSFPEGGVALEDARGVLGGVPAQVNALWRRKEGEIQVEVEYGDGEGPPLRREGPAGEWLAGRFEIERTRLYRWPVRGLEGTLGATGARVRIDRTRGRLAEGALALQGSLSLAEADSVPLRIQLEVQGGNASRLGSPLGLGASRISGRASVEGSVEGRMGGPRPFLEDAEISLQLRLEDGTIHDLPPMVVLARLPSLRGIRGLFGEPLPYTSLTAGIEIENGRLRTQDFLLRGPELDLMAAGGMNLVSAGREVDLLIALLMLQTVDRMIETLPVVRDLILGRDRNLVTVYVRIEGPRDRLQARLVPPETVRLARDVTTRIIAGGVAQLRRLIGFPRSGGSSDDHPDQAQGQ